MSNKTETALVVGASSGVGRRLAEDLAQRGYHLILIARSERDLIALGKNLELKYSVQVKVFSLDLGDRKVDLVQWMKDFILTQKNICHLFLTAAAMSASDEGLSCAENIHHLTYVNYNSLMIFSIEMAKYFKKNQMKGEIIYFSSIAAHAPRGKNLAYAASKAAAETFLKSLRHSLANDNVLVKIYILGYVDTSLSFGQKLLFPKASTEKVCQKVLNDLSKDTGVIYYPPFWKWIIFLIKTIPWFIYKKMSF